tara:strand:- start:1452 stop:1730 length:279 start_codon:yes stop_codon:yes gene_type:complete
MQNGVSGWVLKQAAQRVWQHSMEEKENKKPISLGINENSFELILRILGNEFIAIRIGSTNFSGKLIAGSILLLFFTFMLLEVFGLSRVLGIE